MREIKFRAWNNKTKKMIDPHKTTPLALHPDCAELKGVFIPFHDDIELMQYTGLHDRHGKEIYEGDIVRTSECLLEDQGEFKIMWGDKECRYFLVWLEDNEIHSSLDVDEIAVCHIEVIGNIWEGTK